MPQRTNEFQQLVYQIQHQLKDRPDTVVTESKMLVDRNTGKLREVDIAVECRVNDVPFIIALECRSRSRGPAIDWVEQAIKKHEHLSDKLVLVANRDFSPDALDIARREGVDTVVLGDADSTDWCARIDQYKNLFFATFEFEVKSYSIEYEYPPGATLFDINSIIEVTDVNGIKGPLALAVDTLVRSPDVFLKRAAKLWYDRPLDQRRHDHTITTEFEIAADKPMMLSQGTLFYPLRKVKIEVAAKIAEAPLALNQTAYKETRVVHGKATLVSGNKAAESVHFVMTETQGQAPKATIIVLTPTGATTGPARTVHLEPTDPIGEQL